MFEEFEHLENTVPSEVLVHQVHKTIAGFEPNILSAIQMLEAQEKLVSHKKLLELIILTKNELYCIFENPYAILDVYKHLEEMKQKPLDLVPEDFTWYRTFTDALEPVYELINIPLKLMFLHMYDKELLAIDLAKNLSSVNIPREIFDYKLKGIRVILGFLMRNNQEKEIERLSHLGELFYPVYLQGGP